MDYCFTWARDYQGDNNSSVELLRERIAGLRPTLGSLIALPVTYYGVPEQTVTSFIAIYPNPVHEIITVKFDGKETISYYLYTISGKLVSGGILMPGANKLDFSSFIPGMYLFNCGNEHIKVIKM